MSRMKIDRQRYETDAAYKAKVDAHIERRRAYNRMYWQKHYHYVRGPYKQEYKEKAKMEPEKNEVKSAPVVEAAAECIEGDKANQTVTAIRRVFCLGCAPGATCVMHIPCDTESGMVDIYCPADGEGVKGVIYEGEKAK